MTRQQSKTKQTTKTPKIASKVASKVLSKSSIHVDDNIDLILAEALELNKSDPVLQPFALSSTKSANYQWKQAQDEKTFEETLVNHNPALYNRLFARNENGVPMLFELVSDKNQGTTRDKKVKLFSETLKTFAIVVKNKRDGKPLEPSTTNVFIRSFLSYVKEKYQINMSLSDDFNFTGGLCGTKIYCLFYLFIYSSYRY